MLKIFLFTLFFRGVFSLYADQAGELDWKREQVGAVQIAVYQQRRVYIVADASGVGVVAALNVRSGSVEWRRLLPETGEALALTPYAAITLSGRFLRAWRLGDGALLWDAAVYAPDSESKASSLIALTERLSTPTRTKKCLVMALTGDIIETRDCASGEIKHRWLPDPEENAKLGAICASSPVYLKQLQAMPDNKVLALGACGGRSLIVLIDPLSGGSSAQDDTISILSVTSAPFLSSVLLATARGMPLLVAVNNKKLQAYDVVAALSSKKNVDNYRVKAGLSINGDCFTETSHDDITLSIEPNSAGRLLRLTNSNQSSRFVVAASVESEQSLILLGWGSCQAPLCTLGAFATPSSAASGSGESEARVFWSQIENGKVSLIDSESDLVLALNQSIAAFQRPEEKQVLKLFPHVFEKKSTEELGYRVLCLTKSESVVMISMQNGEIAWIRDEALAAITALDFASGPHRSKVIEENDSEHWHRRLHLTFSQRLKLQAITLLDMVSKFNNTLASFTDKEGAKATAKRINAERYGFDKLAIAGTRSGRVAALAMHTGETLWSTMVPGSVTSILTVRDGGTSAPEIAVLCQSSETSEWILFILNGHDGTRLRAPMYLGSERIQLMARTGAHANGEDILLIAREINSSYVDLRVSPQGSGEAVLARRLLKGGKPLYFNLKVQESGAHMLKVYQIKVSEIESKYQIVSELRGELVLAQPGESLLSVAYARPDLESVSSKAHIMGDDALLLKYLNPHLTAVCTSTPGGDPAPLLDSKLRPPSEESVPSEPPSLFLTLIDSVAARVVTRITLPYGTGPCALSVSENWVVAAYWNAKAKRQELASVSLHEGVIDRYGLSPFKVPEQESIFVARAAPPPVALYRSFALDKPILSLVPTVTTRGIASKHFLLAVAPGQIAALDRRSIDPRRPAIDLSESSSKKSISRAMRKKFERELDEGLQPYSPFLLLKPRTFLTYTHQLMGLTDLYTCPAKLESTTLVFAAGIDLYGARYTPSGAFDLLADDFNYLLLLLLLSALALASLLLRIASKRKQLRLLWA